MNSLKKNSPIVELNATEELLDETFIAKAVWECLKNNDPEGVIEVIQIHFEAVNKVKATQSNHRTTIYNALKGKNPTVRTLAKFVNSYVQ